MSNGLQAAAEATIPFAERFTTSQTFHDLFREGMGLVEETAAYLDGDGRGEAKGLGRNASLTYATESMRLTTRLMQLASWLLLQRAVSAGEITQSQAGSEKSKVRLDGSIGSMSGPSWDELPEALKTLIGKSVRLQERLRHLDAAIYSTAAPAAANPIGSQLGRLADAFGARA